MLVCPVRVDLDLLNPVGDDVALVRCVTHPHPQGRNAGVEIEMLMGNASGHHRQNGQIVSFPIMAHAVYDAISLAAQDEDKSSALVPVHARVLMNLLLED